MELAEMVDSEVLMKRRCWVECVIWALLDTESRAMKTQFVKKVTMDVARCMVVCVLVQASAWIIDGWKFRPNCKKINDDSCSPTHRYS
jgi:hypothetical protein